MYAVSAKALELLRPLKLFGKPGCLAGLFYVSANSTLALGAIDEMELQIRHSRPSANAKCIFKNDRKAFYKMVFRFFDFSDFFHKVTLERFIVIKD